MTRAQNNPFMHRVRQPAVHEPYNTSPGDADKHSQKSGYGFGRLRLNQNSRGLVIADLSRTQPPSPTLPNDIFRDGPQSAKLPQLQPQPQHKLPQFSFETGSKMDSSFELAPTAQTRWKHQGALYTPPIAQTKYSQSATNTPYADSMKGLPASPEESVGSPASSEDPHLLTSGQVHHHHIYPASATRADFSHNAPLFPKRNYSLPSTPAPLAAFELDRYEFASIEQLDRKWGEIKTEATKILRSAIYKYYFSHGAWSDFEHAFPDKVVGIWDEFQAKLPESEAAYLGVPLISQNPFAPEEYDQPYTPVIARAIPLPQVLHAIASSGDMRSRARQSGESGNTVSATDKEFADWLHNKFNALKAAPQPGVAGISPPASAASTGASLFEREPSLVDSVVPPRTAESLARSDAEQNICYEDLCSVLGSSITPRNSSDQRPLQQPSNAGQLPDLNLPAPPPKMKREKQRVPVELRKSYKNAKRRTQNFFSSQPGSSGWDIYQQRLQKHQQQSYQVPPPLPINNFTRNSKALPPIPVEEEADDRSTSTRGKVKPKASDTTSLATDSSSIRAPKRQPQHLQPGCEGFEDSLNLGADYDARPVSPASIARSNLGVNRPYANSSASLLSPNKRLGSTVSAAGQLSRNPSGVYSIVDPSLERPRSSTLTIKAIRDQQLAAPTIAVKNFLDLDSPQEKLFGEFGGAMKSSVTYDWRYVPPDTGTAWGFQISPLVYHEPLPHIRPMMSSLVIQANIPTLNHRDYLKQIETTQLSPIQVQSTQHQPLTGAPAMQGMQGQHQGSGDGNGAPDVHLILREAARVMNLDKQSWDLNKGLVLQMRMVGLEVSRIAEQDFYDFCVDELLKASVDAFNDVSMMGNDRMATEIFNSFNEQLNHLLSTTGF